MRSGFLDDDSRIVQGNAMTALADRTLEHPRLHEGVSEPIEAAMEGGSPAVRARGRTLLAALESAEE